MRIFKLSALILIGGILVGSLVFVISAFAFENITKKTEENIILSSTTSTQSASLAAPPTKITVEPVVIVQVVDSSTVKVMLNDGTQEVELIGVAENSSCPEETVIPQMENLTLGKKAYLIEDESYESETQKYVFLDDLTFLNQEYIKRGLADAESDEEYLYKEEFLKSETNQNNCTIKPTKTQVKIASEDKGNLFTKLIITSTPAPSVTPTSTPAPTEVKKQETLSASKPASLNPEILFLLINNHRASIGKAPFEKDERLCQLARERGPELYNEIFVTHSVHAGLKNRNLPFWITENMAHYDTEAVVFNWWMNSGLHRGAIEGDYKYSCGECYGNSCAQLFTSWVPK